MKDESQPLISIGIPTYNGGRRIGKALNSIWIQGYNNVEVIISDNGSTDDTYEVCRQALKQHPTSIRYYRQAKNIGVLSNFEFTLSKATGRYFMWLSDDDQLEPGVLSRYVHFLEKHYDFVLVSGEIYYWQGAKLDYIESGFNIENKNKAIRTIRYYNKVVYGGMFHGLMRRDAASLIPTRKVFGNDFHFVASLAYLGKIKNLSLPGYHKYLGGISKDVHANARGLGESRLASAFPHLKLAIDSFREVMFRSPLFARIPAHQRFPFALSCLVASFLSYYGRIYPLTIAGKIKRAILRVAGINSAESIFKKKSLRFNTNKVLTQNQQTKLL